MVAESDGIARFPRGLFQPPGSFRFSADALLLAAFALSSASGCRGKPSASHSSPGPLWIDLGTGCGIVGLAALRLAGLPRNAAGELETVRFPKHAENLSEPFCYGLDRNEELVAAARSNARNLGLERHFAALTIDFSSPQWPHTASTIRNSHGRAALVLANPPWRLEKTGRMPATEARRKALFGNAGTFPLFVRAAATLRDPSGRFGCVVGADRLPDMFAALHSGAFNPLRLRLVHPSTTAPAVWALVASRRTGRTPLPVEPPLVLRGSDGNPTSISLEFCPLLR